MVECRERHFCTSGLKDFISQAIQCLFFTFANKGQTIYMCEQLCKKESMVLNSIYLYPSKQEIIGDT